MFSRKPRHSLAGFFFARFPLSICHTDSSYFAVFKESVFQSTQSGGLILCPAHCQVLGSRFVPLEPI
ncbi:uncharacterized protein METZ01_LOCUS508808, partial [marine metagenome]